MTDNEFIELAMCHIEQMYRLAYARLGNKLDAEDVVQETYLRAYRSASSFRQDSSLKSWLTRILLNSISDHFRKSSRTINTLNLDDSLDLDNSGPTVAGPEEILCTQETVANLRHALNAVPEIFAVPLLLREIHDATYDEIAEILNIPRGTVMSRLFRARGMLKKILLKNGSSCGAPCDADDDGTRFIS